MSAQGITGNVIRIFVTVPDGNGYTEPKFVKRIDEHLSQFDIVFVRDPLTQLPLQNEAGEYEMNVRTEQLRDIATRVIKGHYGLVVSRVVSDNAAAVK